MRCPNTPSRPASVGVGSPILLGLAAALVLFFAPGAVPESMAAGRTPVVILLWLRPFLYCQGFSNPEICEQYATTMLAGPGQSFSTDLEGNLKHLGYTPGKDLTIDPRSSVSTADLAALVAHAAVIVAVEAPAVEAARRATSTVPIVMVNVDDPVGLGFVHSLNRPGGNITGITAWAGFRRKVEAIHEAVPAAGRIGILFNPAESLHLWQVNHIEPGMRPSDVELIPIEVGSEGALDGTFAEMRGKRIDAAVVLEGRDEKIVRGLARRAIQDRIPAVFGWWSMAMPAPHVGSSASALMAVAAATDPYRMAEAAGYVDKILKGADPSEMQVQEPKTRIIINLQVADAIGLKIPATVVHKADKVIRGGVLGLLTVISMFLLFLLPINPFGLPVLAYIVYQIWLVVRLPSKLEPYWFRVVWKIIALVPVAFMGPLIYKTLKMLQADVDLWPLLLILASLLALAVLGLLHLTYWAQSGSSQINDARSLSSDRPTTRAGKTLMKGRRPPPIS